MGRGRNGGGQARRGGNTLMQRLLQKHVTDIFEELQPLPADAAEQAEAVYSVLSQRHKDKFHQPREKLLPQIDQGEWKPLDGITHPHPLWIMEQS